MTATAASGPSVWRSPLAPGAADHTGWAPFSFLAGHDRWRRGSAAQWQQRVLALAGRTEDSPGGRSPYHHLLVRAFLWLANT